MCCNEPCLPLGVYSSHLHFIEESKIGKDIMQLDTFNSRESTARTCFNRTSDRRADFLQVDTINYKIKCVPACILKGFGRKVKRELFQIHYKHGDHSRCDDNNCVFHLLLRKHDFVLFSNNSHHDFIVQFM